MLPTFAPVPLWGRVLLAGALIFTAGCGAAPPEGDPAPEEEDEDLSPLPRAPTPGPGDARPPFVAEPRPDRHAAADGAADTRGSDGPPSGSDGGSPAADARSELDDAGSKTGPAPDPTPGSAGPLPVVFIDTSGKRMPRPQDAKIPAKLKLVVDHDGQFDWRTLRPLETRPVAFEGTIGINGHGNASWSFLPMKSYNLEFRDAAGKGVDTPLLGMPAHADWLLYACYNDKPCMRNTLAYTWARQMGHWAARFRYVEVVLDGKYNGMYVLMERIRQDKHRVAIPKPAPEPPGDVSGGYIWKLDSPVDSAAHVWRSRGGLTYGYHYPKHDKITAAQKKYLQEHLNAFEALWQGPLAPFGDPQTGYRKWIDVKSFIDYALINEISNNGDGLCRSAYFHKQSEPAGNRIFAGPVWDYDLAFGSDLRGADRTDIWNYRVIGQKFKSEPNFANFSKIVDLWTRLWEDRTFQNDMKCRYAELRKNVLTNAAVSAHVDGWARDLVAAQKRHHQKWPVIGKEVFGFRDLTQKTWEDDLRYLKNFVFARLKFLDERLPGTCPR